MVLSIGSLSAADPQAPKPKSNPEDFSGELGDSGDEVLDGLGIHGTGVFLEKEKQSNPEEDKRVELFIQGAFCMVTFLLFTAGYIGTKSHKGSRVHGVGGIGENGRFCGRP